MNAVDSDADVMAMRDVQMLSGDAEIDLDAYRVHYAPELEEVRLFCLSHHGAWRNWEADLLDIHANCHLWVCSSGLGNTYGHPGPQVVRDIIGNSRTFLECNQSLGLAFHGTVGDRP